jgi:putative acetyltransferase
MQRMLDEVLPLRHASRELVRELGFLQARDAATSLSHSHCHALIEIEGRGSVPQSELPKLLRLDKSTTSRIVAELETRGWVKARSSPEDARVRLLALTHAGRAKVAYVHREANLRVSRALETLTDDERRTVLDGMQIYARALERSRRRAAYAIRPMKAGDRDEVATLIRTVMPEFGAKGPGYAIEDAEVDDMFTAYRAARSGYFVVTREAKRAEKGEKSDVVVGGGGFAPLAGGDDTTCELRKMYFYPEVRGLGIGQELLALCLDGARRAKFERMYLETLPQMTRAIALYAANAFERCERMGDTGHPPCSVFMMRAI